MNVKICLRIEFASICFAAILLFVPSTKADISAFVPSVILGGTQVNFEGTVGLAFAPNRDIVITRLGIFDYGGDGLVNSHEIGLWLQTDNLHGSLLASAIVPAGTDTPLFDGYRWVSIPPLSLSFALAFYSVGAHYSAGDADAIGTPWLPQTSLDIGLLVENGRFSYGSGLTFPSTYTTPPCEGCLGPRFFEPNFQFVIVPEPLTWLLLTPVLLYGVMRRRRSRSIQRSNR